MGVINPENTLRFRSTSELFARILDKLASFDSQNMIDVGSFYDHVAYILNQLGAAVYKECEALISVEDHRAKLPCNFKLWYAAYKCDRHGGGQGAPDINEQNNFGQPFIFYQNVDITSVCPSDCCTNCNITQEKTKIVVRNFVNGHGSEHHFHNPLPLVLSPNVKDHCAPHCMKVVHAGWNEVTIADGFLRTKFNNECIYMQYYGLPIDDNFLPMIPDEESIEKAIEYYIYKMLFEQWYLNSSVPNIVQQLQYATAEYEKYFAQARYWCRMPSFQKMVQMVRVQRGNKKFYQFNSDKTRSGADFYGYGGIYGNRRGYGYQGFDNGNHPNVDAF